MEYYSAMKRNILLIHTLEEGMATPSRMLAWRIPMDRGAWRAAVHGFAELDRTE